jgi:hypothetical protein
MDSSVRGPRSWLISWCLVSGPAGTSGGVSVIPGAQGRGVTAAESKNCRLSAVFVRDP